jgi:hypothetical protein
MFRFIAFTLLAALTVAAAPGSANKSAETADVIEKISAGKLERIVQSFREVKNFEERGNNKYYFELEGFKVFVFSTGNTLQLYALFTGRVSLSRINEWNKNKRFAKAYLDKDNDPILESDLELTGGVTEQNIKEWIKTYYLCLKGFRDHLAE